MKPGSYISDREDEIKLWLQIIWNSCRTRELVAVVVDARFSGSKVTSRDVK
jgi:hypothetical protein